MDTNKNRETELQKALRHLMCAGNHLNAAGFAPASNKEETPKESDTEMSTCVVLKYSDFAQMIQDMIDLSDMNDILMQMLGAKEHLARTLLGVACKMDTSDHEKQEMKNIREHTDAILNKWSNATLTAIEH